MDLARDNDPIPHIWCELPVRRAVFVRAFERENMNHWIDLLIVIPCWLGVFAGIGVIIAEVVG